jgi:hypothetical protein
MNNLIKFVLIFFFVFAFIQPIFAPAPPVGGSCTVSIDSSSYSADVGSSVTMGCKISSTSDCGTTIDWSDNTANPPEFTTIPANDTDIDCSGQTCQKTNASANTWYYHDIDCEAEGSYSVRCDAGSSSSSISTLTCNAASSVPEFDFYSFLTVLISLSLFIFLSRRN